VIIAVCFEGDGVWRVAIANAVIAVDTNDGYCRDLQDRRRSGCGAAATRGRLRNRGRWRQQRPDQKGRRQRRSHQKRGPIGPFQSHKEERAQPGVRASERGGNRRGPRGFTLRVPAQPLGICRSPLSQSGFDSLSSSLSRRAASPRRTIRSGTELLALWQFRHGCFR